MQIRKLTGEAEGWATAVCLQDCHGFDDDGNPYSATKGTEYYVKGDLDPAFFELGDGPPLPKPPEDFGEIEEEVE